MSAVRLTREVRERGYTGAYATVKRLVAAIRPNDGPKPFEVRFETPAGHQAQVDFARFVLHQDLQTLFCYTMAFEATGGVPIEIVYDRIIEVPKGEHASVGRNSRTVEFQLQAGGESDPESGIVPFTRCSPRRVRIWEMRVKSSSTSPVLIGGAP